MQSLGINYLKFLRSNVINKLRNRVRVAFSDKYLFYTNTGLSITLSGVGDVLEQYYEIHKGYIDKFDFSRTFRMSMTGMTVGIFCHHWYNFLDNRLPGRSISIVLKKVVIDQLIASPICISTFFLTLACLEKQSLDEFKNEVFLKAWKLYLAEWFIWPPAQVINFYVLPTKYRVFYDSTISLGYDVYTSHVKHADANTKEPDDSKRT